MIYFGTKKQKEVLNKLIEEIETGLVFEENRQKIEKMQQDVVNIKTVTLRGFGIVNTAYADKK